MGLDDLLSSETAFVAAATAAVFSPRTRETIRRGAVLGVAGVLKAGDVVAGAAQGAVRGVKGEESASEAEGNGSAPAAPRTRSRSGAANARTSRAKTSGASAKP